MRGFILICLVATASARAEQLGYSYQSGGHDSSIGNGGGHNGGGSSNAVGGSGGGFGIGNGANNGFGGFSSGSDRDGSSTGIGSGSGSAQLSQPIQSEFNKEFYSYSAPEEEFTDNSASQRIADMMRRNLRVVFIRAPENQGLTNAALQLAKQASEDKTAIYVLSKQADIGDLAQKLQSAKSSSDNRPEVHFVKYRTPEDAVRAQQIIQSEYDTLSGPSRSSHEGATPVLNFASAPQQGGASSNTGSFGSNLAPSGFVVGNQRGGGSGNDGGSNVASAPAPTTYLPPSALNAKKKRRSSS